MRIIINNSESQFEGLDLDQIKSLKRALSFYVPNGSNPTLPPLRKTLMSSKGVFPTGLLGYVNDWCDKVGVDPEVKDLRKKPLGCDYSFPKYNDYANPPYPEQFEAAIRATDSERGIIVAPTGAGKSKICAGIISLLGVPTLVVVPSLELKKQLSQYLRKVFGDTDLIVVENVDALKGKKLNQKFGCLIIDEFHHSGAAGYRELNKTQWKDIYYRFGLTATPFRSQDHEKMLLESVLAEVVYKISYETAVEKGYVVPIEAGVVPVPKTKVVGKTWRSVYSELVVDNETRNKIIADLLKYFLSQKMSTLCLVKEISHGRVLSELSRVPFANGQDENSSGLIQAFSSGSLPALIGTEGVVGEGVDTKPCEVVIIAGLGKSKNRLMQAFGRTMRKHEGKKRGLVVLLSDPSHKWTKSHLKAQMDVLYAEYGVTPDIIELD